LSAEETGGLINKHIVQLTHVISDFASYHTLNIALDTDYDYRIFDVKALALRALRNV